MTAREVEVNEFVRGLGTEDRRSVLEALGRGLGVARFGHLVLTYGGRDAVITSKFPPAQYGSAEIGDFVAPPPVPASMRSPLLDAVGGPPQIRRPRVSPSFTEYPDVQIQTRTSPHPRGNSGGFIEPQRLLPGREQQEVVPETPLSESASWMAEHLGR
jgi:hypothetical protein